MRILGINIPDEKKIRIALTYIYGIGPNRANNILVGTKIDPNKKAKALDASEVNSIKEYIDKNYKVEGELRLVIRQHITLLKDIKSYRGSRHNHRLPARGQRTKTNSRTIRGNVRRTAGSGKRKVELR
ncbi:TPA: 30S ribosomal protein S13 [Patescibacteria group bacterium]|nr:30S ribosomal protein S13 [Patescibacteria group bacterium]|tara:strand:+ start:2661 stop:3044 length:384 start_codon:yes stop_codon:yes gene_type:complete